jgi:hypothetical protein
LRGDQRGARTAPLNDGVGAERGAVDCEADLTRRDGGFLQHQRDAADHTFFRGGRSGQHLSRKEALRGLEDNIREGPPNIDGKPATFHSQRSVPYKLSGYQ